MSVPVLVAVSGSAWEADIVGGLEAAESGVRVARRCVDLADLLSAAAAGTARAALVSAGLRQLDRDALARLGASRVGVVALCPPTDEDGERRLRQMGVCEVLPADAAPSEIAAALTRSVLPDRIPLGGHDYGNPTAALTDLPDSDGGFDAALHTASPDPVGAQPRPGRLLAVWGPTGAPGRTTVAVGLAAELAASGRSTVLADADTYGGAIAQLLGLLDEAPGLAAAARLANLGRLDLVALANVAPTVAPDLRVLTGISRAERWPELRPAALEAVWSASRRIAAFTVVDCGFSLEQDEELSFDTAAPRRNGAALATLAAADTVIAVGAADPVGLHRLVRGLDDLRETLPETMPTVVINKVRRSVVGGDPARVLAEVLHRHAGVTDHWLLPDDRNALDRALREGRMLSETSPDSPLRSALRDLAARLDPDSSARRRPRFRGQRRLSRSA